MNMNLGKSISFIGAGVATAVSAGIAAVLDFKRTKKFNATNDAVVETEHVRKKFWQKAIKEDADVVSVPMDDHNTPIESVKKSVEL